MVTYDMYLILTDPELYRINEVTHFNIKLLKNYKKWNIYFNYNSFKNSKGYFWNLIDYKDIVINKKYNQLEFINKIDNLIITDDNYKCPDINIENNNEWINNYIVKLWISPYFIEYQENKNLLEVRLELVDLN